MATQVEHDSRSAAYAASEASTRASGDRVPQEPIGVPLGRVQALADIVSQAPGSLRNSLASLFMFEDRQLYQALHGVSGRNLARLRLVLARLALDEQLSCLHNDDQTLFGYHSLGLNKSSLNYSRDALSGPLRRYDRILEKIRSGLFNPDDTRSGRWQSSSSSQDSQSVSALIQHSKRRSRTCRTKNINNNT